MNKVTLTTVIIIVGLLLQFLFHNLIKQNVRDSKRKFKLHRIVKSSIETLTVIAVLFVWIQAINELILLALLFGVFIVFIV